MDCGCLGILDTQMRNSYKVGSQQLTDNTMLVQLLAFLVMLTAAILVARSATARGINPVRWGIGSA